MIRERIDGGRVSLCQPYKSVIRRARVMILRFGRYAAERRAWADGDSDNFTAATATTTTVYNREKSRPVVGSFRGTQSKGIATIRRGIRENNDRVVNHF